MNILVLSTKIILTYINFFTTNLEYYDPHEEEEQKGKKYSGIVRS
jgi:hypothetical protein